MLLSYERSFLFVHVDKTAGNSMQLALQPFALPRKKERWRRRLVWLGQLNRLGLYRTLEFPGHSHIRTVKRCLPPEIFDNMFKFAFVRNPWDRLVSLYAFFLGYQGHRHNQRLKSMSGFEEYLAWEIKRGKRAQYPYLTDAQGKLLVTYVGYYERIHEDFNKICAKLGFEANLPKVNVSKHRDYRTYYTPATRDLVAKHFQRDIELFGYDFDGIAAKSPIVPSDRPPLG